ncbi:MAG: EAL domain-containing protein, partial [Desulfovibrionaceae bacterium]
MTMEHKRAGHLGRFMGFFSPLAARGDARREEFMDAARRERLARRVAGSEGAFLISLEIPGFFAFLSLYGEDIAQYVSRQAREELGRLAGTAAPRRSRLEVEQVDCGRFVALLGGEVPDPPELLRICLTLRLAMKQWLKRTTMRLTRQALEVRVGYAVLEPGRDFEAALYDAACAAQRTAAGLLADPALGLAREFQEIVANGLVQVLYQPIAELATGRVIGWEALTRGPRGSYFHTPTALFDYAEQTGGVFQLERLYRETAIRGLGGMDPGQKVFMNLHLDTLLDPEFTSGETLRALEGTGLTPSNVVFEVTERHAIRDFPLFRTTIGHYRSQGFGVAVDDVGAGYSGLWSMAEFTPDYIKLDFSLTREIDTHPVKRGLIKTFLAFAESFGCELIAKGIERDTELTSLISMGVHHGEGYHLGRPASPKPVLSLSWPEWSGAAP